MNSATHLAIARFTDLTENAPTGAQAEGPRPGHRAPRRRVHVVEGRCPHRGARRLLRCPWHGYDCDPLTGKPPAGIVGTAQRGERHHLGLPRRMAARAAVAPQTSSPTTGNP